ncbi:MAG TPA: hypothetical protein VMV10_28865 [Pirellulales bacterium]|nr:hypothetical protein [Pirellulales bacterium]
MPEFGAVTQPVLGITVCVGPTPIQSAVTQQVKVAAEPSRQSLAIGIRARWMRHIGMSEEEIAELCDPSKYPADLSEEVDNLLALGLTVEC